MKYKTLEATANNADSMDWLITSSADEINSCLAYDDVTDGAYSALRAYNGMQVRREYLETRKLNTVATITGDNGDSHPSICAYNDKVYVAFVRYVDSQYNLMLAVVTNDGVSFTLDSVTQLTTLTVWAEETAIVANADGVFILTPRVNGSKHSIYLCRTDFDGANYTEQVLETLAHSKYAAGMVGDATHLYCTYAMHDGSHFTQLVKVLRTDITSFTKYRVSYNSEPSSTFTPLLFNGQIHYLYSSTAASDTLRHMVTDLSNVQVSDVVLNVYGSLPYPLHFAVNNLGLEILYGDWNSTDYGHYSNVDDTYVEVQIRSDSEENTVSGIASDPDGIYISGLVHDPNGSSSDYMYYWRKGIPGEPIVKWVRIRI